MNVKDAERRLGEALAPSLAQYGFVKDGWADFIRRTEKRVDRIGFSVYADRVGKIRASCDVGLRFPSVEGWRPGERGKNAPTVAVPIHFLLPDRKYFDWLLNDLEDWRLFGGQVDEVIVQLALPFFERYASLDAVRAALESGDPRDWFTLDQMGRIETLALIHCASGAVERGLELLDRTLSELADAPMKTRYPLIRFRDSLRAMQASADI